MDLEEKETELTNELFKNFAIAKIFKDNVKKITNFILIIIQNFIFIKIIIN